MNGLSFLFGVGWLEFDSFFGMRFFALLALYKRSVGYKSWDTVEMLFFI